MSLVKLPLASPTYRNSRRVELNAIGDTMYDGYTTDLETVCARWGLVEFADTGAGSVRGMWFWQERNLVVVVAGTQVFSLTEAGVLTNITGDALTATERPSFAYDDRYCYVCDGGSIIFSDGATSTAYITHASAPTSAVSLCTLNKRVLAVQAGTQRIYYSEVNDGLTWAGYFTAEGEPDVALEIARVDRQIFVLGSCSGEFYYDDGVTPFSRNDSRFVQQGSCARNALLVLDGVPFWLSDKRKLVALTGNAASNIDDSFNKELFGLSVVEDAFLAPLEQEGRGMIMMVFPQADRALVYDYKVKKWSEFTDYNEGSGTRSRWLANCSCTAGSWGRCFVGSKNNGKIYYLSSTAYLDGTAPIHFSRTTGHIDHGSALKKTSRSLRVKVQRGEGASAATMLIRWRNNNSDNWSDYRSVDLGLTGDRNVIKNIYALGQYNTRQWEFSCASNVPFSLIEVWEDVELENV